MFMTDIFFMLHCIFVLHINVIAHKSFPSDITHGIILTDFHLLLQIQNLVPPKVKASLYYVGVFSILRQDLVFYPLKETTFLLFLQNSSICGLIIEIFMH